MEQRTTIALTPKDRFIEAAKAELAKFEAKEREFRLRMQQHRAKELRIPVDLPGRH